MPRSETKRGCGVCQAIEPETVDRLLALGYGPSFVAARWGLPRHRVKLHRDECLVGERRQRVEEDLQRKVEKTGGVR
jgi:hypothetical protein